MLPPRSPGMAKMASVVRDKTKKPMAASAVSAVTSRLPGITGGAMGPAGFDASRDAWANALSTMSGVNTPTPLTALAKVAGMGLAGYGQGKAVKAKEEGTSAYRARLAEALSGQPGNADLVGLMNDPYADEKSQSMLWNLYERNNPTPDEMQQRQLRDLQMQQTQMTMQQQQEEAARQQAIRGGQMDAVTGFMDSHEAMGGDLFSPEMQAGLRAQGIAGVDPADTRRYEAMQPYAAAGDYANAFEQYAAQPAAGEGYTLGEGQIRYDGNNRPVAVGGSGAAQAPKVDTYETTDEQGNPVKITREWRDGDWQEVGRAPVGQNQNDDAYWFDLINKDRAARGQNAMTPEEYMAAKKGNGITIRNPDGTVTQIGGGSTGDLAQGDKRILLLGKQALTQEPVIYETFDAMSDPRNLAGSSIPGGRLMMTAEGKQAYDAISNVVGTWLYIVSGATATDAEVAKRTNEILPAVGDDARTQQYKRARLQSYFDGMREAINGMPGQQALPPPGGDVPQPGAGAPEEWTVDENGNPVRVR